MILNVVSTSDDLSFYMLSLLLRQTQKTRKNTQNQTSPQPSQLKQAIYCGSKEPVPSVCFDLFR